ncbi:SAV_2336 N-terminal domain-related protein [Streptomyces sp. NPDC012888]|uniref:SAV_2336 N-terminal domain-related protein n=1 Tax=Streptomyces sp. NPDC012888 TaxID=3364855 RepID=UPI0036C499D4
MSVPDLRRLVGVLRAGGLDPTDEELADALWLAGHTARAAGHRPGGAPPAADTGEEDEDHDDRAARPARPAGRRPPDPTGRPPGSGDDGPLTLYVPGPPEPATARGGPAQPPPGGAALPVRVPGAAALPRILDIQRALRALQRHRPPGPPARMVLDEAATAEASARALGQVIPVLRPETGREATIRLVMDASPSMAVWQDMFDELRAVCERLGAFRDVQAHFLHRQPDGTPAVGRGPSPGTGLRSADQLRDPTRRGITLVVSDCTGPMWREGRAQRLLHRWTECTPTAIVQPLPQRLWGRTWLPTERGTLSRVEGVPGGLGFRAGRAALPDRPAPGLAVPVLPPSARALGAWARLVAGLGTGPVPAEVGRVLAGHPAAAPPAPRAARPPLELVRRFRSTASPRAVQLAVYLSATPLTLPVMRLVQRTMLPDSEPSDLAEVLLGGLLRRTADQWYEFVPGVQEVLLGPLGRDEAALVLKHASEYVLQHFGQGVRNFPALAAAQLTGEPAAEPGPDAPPEPCPGHRAAASPLPQAFAQVSAKVVSRYLPGPPPGPATPSATPLPDRDEAVRAARARLAAYDRDGGQRALHEAVAMLRRAVAANGAGGPAGAAGDPGPYPAGPPARGTPGEAEHELAGALLRLWTLLRDPELLAEAEAAVGPLPGPRARAMLGRVLAERARLAGPAGEAELLAAAEREFASVGPGSVGDREFEVDCAVRRAGALTRLHALRAEAELLHRAHSALEAWVDALRADTGGGRTWPDRGSPLLLASGRVLLALAEHEEDPERRAAWAERAAGRLGEGLRAMPARGGKGSRREHARAQVDLAGALRFLPARLEEAVARLAEALAEAAGEPELMPAALVCLARVHRSRYAQGGAPQALEAAAEAYGRARRLLPRDGEAFAELLPEWGEVLLERARAEDGRRFASAAVRVLRDSRAAVPQSDPGAARRLLRLADGLRLRHAYEGDLVDLREAEYLLELAVRAGHDPLDRALAWREHGDVQREIHTRTRAVDRLDRAADSYRRAWRAALEADRAGRGEPAARLAARAQQLRGEVLERLERPRAALDAYRAALELWLPLDAETDRDLRAATLARVRALGGR